MNITKQLFILVLLFFSAGCSQQSSGGNNGSFQYNSLYLNLTNNIPTTMTDSTSIFQAIIQDYDNRINQEVLYHQGIRPTTVHFGTLENQVLGLTQCNYYSDGTSNCDVTLSNVINPDTVSDHQTKAAREVALGGVLRHELGHAFGMGHIKNNPMHVMYPYFNQNQTEDGPVSQFITDLNNFRYNGAASGLPDMSTK
jgi:predicted Zn-dependent protease